MIGFRLTFDRRDRRRIRYRPHADGEGWWREELVKDADAEDGWRRVGIEAVSNLDVEKIEREQPPATETPDREAV